MDRDGDSNAVQILAEAAVDRETELNKFAENQVKSHFTTKALSELTTSAYPSKMT